MPETEPVVTRIQVDDTEVQAKFDEFERRIKAMEAKPIVAGKASTSEIDRTFKRTEQAAQASGKRTGNVFFSGMFLDSSNQSKAQQGGKKASSAFVSGLVGGAVGFAVGAATQNDAVSAVLELLTNIVAAALLPVLVALLPLIVALTPVLVGIGEAVGKLIEWLTNQANTTADKLIKPMTDEERQAYADRRGGGMPAPEGTVLNTPGGGTRTVDREETVRLPFPIPIPVNREKLWGPDIVG